MLEIINHSDNLCITSPSKGQLVSDGVGPLRKGMLVVSLGSHIFSRRMIAETATLGLQYCQDFTIMLVDHPSRLNWPLATISSMERQQKLWMQVSGEKRRGYQQEIQATGLSHCVSILSWLELLESPLYHRNLKVLNEAFNTDTIFHDAVVRQTQHNVGGKINDVEQRRKRTLTQSELDCLYQFLLEELSGIFYMQFDRAHYLDIYPGEPMKLLRDIYSNVFPYITASLRYDWSRQAWIQVAAYSATS